MGPHLAADPHHEAPAAKHLHVITQVRQIHGVPGETDGHGGAESQCRGVLGVRGQGDERVMFRLEGETAVVADLLELPELCSRLPRVLQRGGGVDLHLLDSFYSSDQRP